MKWEYCIVQMERNKVLSLHRLLRQGNEGWELVSVDNGIAYFKRPIDKGLSAEEFEKKIEQRLERSFLRR